MTRFWALAATLALALTGCGGGGASGGEGSLRVALGDIESVETLNLMIALERVRERGTEVELIELADEDTANQAVVSGQADIGLGAPYGLIQGTEAPLRIVCQMQSLRFFPIVDKALYPDWQALDGEEFTVHSRGSSTEAMAHIVEDIEDIEFGDISFVPGSEVRATALLRGNVTATVLDIPNKNYVMGEAPGKFHLLDFPDTGASDEVIFGNTDWLQQNNESVQVLLEEILTVARSINEDPSFVVEERERLGLLPDLPAELEDEVLPYYRQASEEGVFTQNCGGPEAAEADFEFYVDAGQLEGEPDDLEVEDFWYLDPLDEAVEAVEAEASS